jgi:UPF0176 protein
MQMKPRLHNRINKDLLKQQLLEKREERTTISFYKYHTIPNPLLFRDHLFLLLDAIGVLGRIYVASEGINAQVSVPSAKLDAFKKQLFTIDFLKDVRLNIAIENEADSFFVLKIKARDKIVADGLDDTSFDASDSGIHLDAEAFNLLVENDNTILVDMRNHYEHEVGHFENAIRPNVETFRESLPIIEELFQEHKDKNLVMYCTGGIRCEKASAYYKHKNFKNVFQLDGGIIQYAKQVQEKGLPNKFIGKNFVFDERLGERISEEIVAKCHQCGTSCDTHKNCANNACHLLFIQCEACASKYKDCCSQKCNDFHQLPEEIQLERRKTETFNGTRFGKGRYKAHNAEHDLEM